ncbi:MAG: hypothetical protein OHK0022_44850 [Roseiflexaceae bacterium]
MQKAGYTAHGPVETAAPVSSAKRCGARNRNHHDNNHHNRGLRVVVGPSQAHGRPPRHPGGGFSRRAATTARERDRVLAYCAEDRARRLGQ